MHPLFVLVDPPHPLVQLAGLEDLDVRNARDAFRYLIAEVRIFRPGDGAFGDRFDDCARVLDGDFLAALGPVTTADAPGVHEIDLEGTRLVQLEEAIALLLVPKGEERIGPGDSERLSHLVLATGRGALRLAEHEVGRRVRRVEPGDARNDVVVAVENQQHIGRPDVARIFDPAQRGQLEGGATVLRVAGVEKVHRSTVFLLRDVFQVGVRLGHRAVNGGLVPRIEAEGLGEAAVLRAIDLSVGH